MTIIKTEYIFPRHSTTKDSEASILPADILFKQHIDKSNTPQAHKYISQNMQHKSNKSYFLSHRKCEKWPRLYLHFFPTKCFENDNDVKPMSYLIVNETV